MNDKILLARGVNSPNKKMFSMLAGELIHGFVESQKT
jgi:hypothetical protein